MQSIMLPAFLCGFALRQGQYSTPRDKKQSRQGFPAAIVCYARPSTRAAVATIRHSPSPSAVGRAMDSAVHFTLPVSL